MTDASAGTDLAVRSADYSLSHTDLRTDLLDLRGQVDRGGRAGLSTTDAAVVAAALVALEGWAAEVQLIPPGTNVAADRVEMTMLEPRPSPPAVAPDVAPTDAPADPTRWVVFTSGTTGEPKAITHTLASLTRTVVARPGGPYKWGLLYDPNRMAGLQVLLQAVRSEAAVVAPALNDPFVDRIRTLIDSGVNALSATPSLWRQILQLPMARSWDLRQITLGGEIADQRVLDALAATFPAARIVHVFASTETAAAFSVKDGRAGFPVDYLTDPPRGIRLDVRDGILYVHSPEVSAAGPDGFASTGDIVEVVDDRVIFRGRSTGVVNVGGANVWPETVETILREHPDVVEAVVSSKPNPMMGNVLTARVSLAPTADPDGIPKRLRAWVRERAPRTHVPASVTVVETIDVVATGKVAR